MHPRILWFALFGLCAAAAATNRTIDDTTGDSVTGNVPTYAPSDAWEGSSCTSCAIQPAQALAHNGTWSAATYNPTMGSMNITFKFTGTAIYVFFILANNAGDGITTKTAANFTIDGALRDSFTHTPSASTDIDYDQLVFTQKALKNTEHAIAISTEGSENIWLAFDYAIYTVPEASSSSSASETASPTATGTHRSTSKKTNVGAIAGGVVAGVIAILAAVALFVCCRKKRAGRPVEKGRLNMSDQMDPLDTALRGPTPSQLTPANLAALSPEAAPPISYAGSDAAGASAYGSGNLRSNYDYSALRSVTDSSASPLPNPHQREAGPASLPGHDSNSIYTSSGAGARLLSTSPPSISSFSASTSAAPAGAPQTKSELRAIRQMELRRQTQEIHRELEELEREEEAARARAGGETGTNARLRELEEEVRLLRAQQAQVQTQLRPSIDEDAPPSYSA